MPLTSTAITIPRGALREGSCVSSLTWALASYPVKVQQASSSPMAKSYPEPRRPVVERARGGVGGGQLGEAGGDRQRQQRHQRPAGQHLQRAAVLQSVAVEGDRPGEDGDDREAECEVGETAQIAQELLRIAQPSQLLGVAIHRETL